MGKYVLAGGTGFIGSALARSLVSRGDQVIILSRQREVTSSKNILYLQWDGQSPGRWASHLEGSTAWINLAGRNINARHTPAVTKEIVTSRVSSVTTLNQVLMTLNTKPGVWAQASAVGYYGN